MKKILNHIFIDGLSGMALGLFSTLIIGTIIGQIGTLVGNEIGTYLIAISSVAKTVTGAGIGVGVAAKFKQGPLVTVSAAVAGMIGAFPALGMESFALGKAGEPLGAFVAALIGIECGRLVAGRTKIEYYFDATGIHLYRCGSRIYRGTANFQFYEMAWKSGKY